jgi:hypothetical protein
MCLFILFGHECCVSIRIVYTWKSCTWLLCLNNAWHSCVNDMNPWNNRFHIDLERTYEVFYACLVQKIISLSTPLSIIAGAFTNASSVFSRNGKEIMEIDCEDNQWHIECCKTTTQCSAL